MYFWVVVAVATVAVAAVAVGIVAAVAAVVGDGTVVVVLLNSLVMFAEVVDAVVLTPKHPNQSILRRVYRLRCFGSVAQSY